MFLSQGLRCRVRVKVIFLCLVLLVYLESYSMQKSIGNMKIGTLRIAIGEPEASIDDAQSFLLARVLRSGLIALLNCTVSRSFKCIEP